jgi:hypothetical protein
MFLLGKLTDDQAHLEGAANAFDQALSVYMGLNAERLSAVASKNLSRVRMHLGESTNESDANSLPTPTLN